MSEGTGSVPLASGEGGRADAEATSSFRWWLRLQLAFVVTGSGTWVVGAVLERSFVTGVGVGILVSALALRLGRRSASDHPEGRVRS